MLRIADNLQVTNKHIFDALEKQDPGPLNREPEKRMNFLVESVQNVTQPPIVLDTANPYGMWMGSSDLLIHIIVITNGAFTGFFDGEQRMIGGGQQ